MNTNIWQSDLPPVFVDIVVLMTLISSLELSILQRVLSYCFHWEDLKPSMHNGECVYVGENRATTWRSPHHYHSFLSGLERLDLIGGQPLWPLKSETTMSCELLHYTWSQQNFFYVLTYLQNQNICKNLVFFLKKKHFPPQKSICYLLQQVGFVLSAGQYWLSPVCRDCRIVGIVHTMWPSLQIDKSIMTLIF